MINKIYTYEKASPMLENITKTSTLLRCQSCPIDNYTRAADCNCFLIKSTSKIRWGYSCREEHLCCHGTGKTARTRSPKAHELSREISTSDRFPSLRFRKKWTFKYFRETIRDEHGIIKIQVEFKDYNWRCRWNVWLQEVVLTAD